ncbi:MULTISPECIES: SRPBCC family protein [unclassified Pedobacter]|jgi:carbon monoxide dehydrogenase subunit G|uniref:SRPBCC family protein n=1 Tax=Pedobacter TaxID=84567 RepID=UPI000B4B7ADC|nr:MULTISPECIES: SRPBCC family protein [unclassified Pedobacter]MCX2430939.1 SRPBCC family protein [Pedobacter sp. GR22-10]MCX2583873.1 SRPBCC family protein [Pedobacter sp. MR22-3]OWK69179.1 orotate phosphoribosyltransferase [Pedobacter sp. AJM]
MTIIESAVDVNRSVAEVYAFLSNMNNHQRLMPENIYNWESTEDEARFTIQNMAKLAIKISNRVENQELTAIPTEKAPFEVELKWTVTDNGNGTTTAKHIITADLNMMMKMLASGPLQKLVDHQTERLKDILG